MRIAGRSFGTSDTWLFVLSALTIVGCTAWVLVPRPSGAGSQSALPTSAIIRVSQSADAIPAKPGLAPAQSVATSDANPAPVTAAPLNIAPPGSSAATSPVDGLRISSQSWRRGGLGSKALLTFTVRNSNDYAVKDIEIACAFAGRDGRHLTDRRRVIPGAVNMKSRKRYAGLLVGFVNVRAHRAKCSLVTADRN